MLRLALPFLLLLAFAAEDARASCAPPNPRQSLKYADAAFDGRFESERTEGDRRWLTFRVDRVVKGELGETVELFDDGGGSSIAFGRFTRGDRVGLLINYKDGAWRANSCHQVDPDELADAVKPIPLPPGRGVARYLVTGAFANARSAVLDARGRTLAYGFGRSPRFYGGFAASVCPGGERFAELGHKQLQIRRTRDLRVVARHRAVSAHRVHCVGRAFVLASGSGLFRGNRRIWRGPTSAVTFRGGVAYLARGHSVVRVDLRSGRERLVAKLDLPPEYDELPAPALSHDGTRLALLAPNHSAHGGERPSRVVSIDLRARPPRVRMADLSASDIWGSVEWAGEDTFAVLPPRTLRGGPVSPPGGAQFFDARLRSRGDVAGWSAWPAIDDGDAVAGLAGHRFVRLTPAGASVVGRLPGSMIGGLHRLPDVRIRASRRIPRY